VSTLGIVELGDVCATMRARSLDLFESTGGWVSESSDADLQRWFADASSRHAWHADLWAERSPTIPSVDAEALVHGHRQIDDTDRTGSDEERALRYRGRLAELLAELDEIGARISPELDPATARAITLTRADLVDLRSR
jgi:hypothetical protein